MSIRPGQAKGPYVGLDGGANSGIIKVISLFDSTSGLPVAPVIGDKYLATETANGWIKDYVYEWTGVSWIVYAAPAEGLILYATLVDQMYTYHDGAWSIYPDFWVKPVIAIYDNTYGLPT